MVGAFLKQPAQCGIEPQFYIACPQGHSLLHGAGRLPAGFVFAVKADRSITHVKKLKEPDRTLPPLWETVAGLGDVLGPMLFHLPPRWRPDLGRLAAFLAALPQGDEGCLRTVRPTLAHRRRPGSAQSAECRFRIYDLAGFAIPRAITADIAYLRLHGPQAAYSGRYGRKALAGWAQWLGSLTVATADVDFDNDEAGHAVQDALELQARLR